MPFVSGIGSETGRPRVAAMGITDYADEFNYISVTAQGGNDNSNWGGPWYSWNAVGTTQSPGPGGDTCTSKADPSGSYCYNSCSKCKAQSIQCYWTTCDDTVTPTGIGTDADGFIPGLYDTLEISGLPYPEAVFELDFFRTNPQPFYELAKALWPSDASRPTKAHKLVKLLADKDQLVRCYTQNIDSLERAAGVPAEYIVAAHGNFDSATCIATGKKVDADELRRAIFEDKTDAFNSKMGGLCKADIVFFGEALPDRFWASLREDFDAAELLLVIGTSLEVHPFASLIDLGTMPRVLINRDRVGEHQPDVAFPPSMGKLSGGFDFNETAPVPRDVFLQGDADAIVVDLVERAGWALD